MANFCVKCGRPLPESGICPCTQKTEAEANNASAFNNIASAPVAAQVKTNAFSEKLKALPRLVADYCKDPMGVSSEKAAGNDMGTGFIILGITTIICFLATLLFVIRYNSFMFIASVIPWLTTGIFAPALASAMTFGIICLMLVLEKKKINFQGLVAAVGVNLLLPTAALVLSLLFSMISYPVFVFFRVVQFVIWAVTAFMLVYKVYNIKSGIIQLLVLLGCSVVSYYVISALANWLVSSLSSYGIFEILSSIF